MGEIEAHSPPKSPFEVRQQVQRAFGTLDGRRLGYRMVQVACFAHHYLAEHGRSPSYRVIGDELGISTKGEVCEIIARLENLGLAVRDGSGTEPRLKLRIIGNGK